MAKPIVRASLFFLVLFLTSTGLCATQYVTDTFKIVLRSGPSTENRIISLLPSGKPVEVVETQGDWSKVKVVLKGDKVVEGWVLSRYLIQRPPWKTQAMSLKEENANIKEELTSVKKRLGEALKRQKELETLLQQTRSAYAKLKKDYESLRKGSKEYLSLKKNYQDLLSEAEANRVEVQRLTAENKRLRSSERNKWFAIGAGVLLCGLLIGIIMGRQQKKRRSYLY